MLLSAHVQRFSVRGNTTDENKRPTKTLGKILVDLPQDLEVGLLIKFIYDTYAESTNLAFSHIFTKSFSAKNLP